MQWVKEKKDRKNRVDGGVGVTKNVSGSVRSRPAPGKSGDRTVNTELFTELQCIYCTH